MAEYIEREAAERILYDGCHTTDGREILDDVVELWHMIQNLPAADVVERPRWIPVTERLPEEWEAVLVCFKSQGGFAQAVSERMGNNWTGLCGLKALWWMPLPEPPKEEVEA